MTLRAVAIALLAVLVAAALLGGGGFLLMPDGDALGLRPAQLPAWYGGDYLLPGIGLLVVFGAGGLLVLALVWRRHPFGWSAVVLMGTALVLWMGVQVAMIGLVIPLLQLGYTALGIGLLVVGTRGARADLER